MVATEKNSVIRNLEIDDPQKKEVLLGSVLHSREKMCRKR